MIRIDEIYDNTFWSWIQLHRPRSRMFHCHPFGHTDPNSVISYGRYDLPNYNYTTFFDQEPIDLARHFATFQHIEMMVEPYDPGTGCLITSEKDSDTVDRLCQHYGWHKGYYFFHGWAALDWYRGYDRTFLMPAPKDRKIQKTFISPNRIIGGQRQHRVIMLYHMIKNNMIDNWISCPAVCPAEQESISKIAQTLESKYPDIVDQFSSQTFPWQFPNESNSPMHSCWLSLFSECSESLLYLVTETVATGRRLHLTEKTFKPICLGMPFVIVGTMGSLEYLRSYGFKTFADLWDESYDQESDDLVRLEKISHLLKSLHELPAHHKQKLFLEAQDVCEHNFKHFYQGNFESILWTELTGMLNDLPN